MGVAGCNGAMNALCEGKTKPVASGDLCPAVFHPRAQEIKGAMCVPLEARPGWAGPGFPH